ncbi:hypothetical protein HOY80DRAFT_114262 [Tuber brumale]|nr:hypothetical protein HOY80DRAFT_114262 [Tuber brumale]
MDRLRKYRFFAGFGVNNTGPKKPCWLVGYCTGIDRFSRSFQRYRSRSRFDVRLATFRWSKHGANGQKWKGPREVLFICCSSFLTTTPRLQRPQIMLNGRINRRPFEGGNQILGSRSWWLNGRFRTKPKDHGRECMSQFPNGWVWDVGALSE